MGIWCLSENVSASPLRFQHYCSMFVLARHELQRRFIAYIVDLTCIMHILFMLTLGENGPYRERPTITRRLVKASYMSYYESQLKAHVHREIRKYDDSKNPIARVRRDNAFELIEELLHTLVEGGKLTTQPSENLPHQSDNVSLPQEDDETW